MSNVINYAEMVAALANVAKLGARYAAGKYSDKAAIARADKNV